MHNGISSEHHLDSNGNPHGGVTVARGIWIGWQAGPLAIDGKRIEPNGAFVEDVIAAAIDRIQFYEKASDGRFSCSENRRALSHLQLAAKALDERTAEREARGVEGTHTP